MEYLDGNLGRELARLSEWRGKIWHRRYHSAIVKNDEASQLERLRYILSNGCKEGLVDSPTQWPGASSTPALLDGSMELQGTWFDRTKEYRARYRGSTETFPTIETVRLTPLPCLAHLERDTLVNQVGSMVREIEEATRAMHESQGTRPAGAKWILKQHPHRVPKDMKHSPAKRFLAAFRASVAELLEAYADFLTRYRRASRSLREGDRLVEFPPGCFPPRLPFVRAGPNLLPAN